MYYIVCNNKVIFRSKNLATLTARKESMDKMSFDSAPMHITDVKPTTHKAIRINVLSYTDPVEKM